MSDVERFVHLLWQPRGAGTARQAHETARAAAARLAIDPVGRRAPRLPTSTSVPLGRGCHERGRIVEVAELTFGAERS